MEDVIDEGDRISARFRYQGTFTNPFMGYRPNRAPVRMRSIDIWRVMDGKLAEHWDELNLLEVFQQIGGGDCKKGGRTMKYLVWPASLVGLVSTAVIFGTDTYFLTVGRPALRLASPSTATEGMGYLHLFGDRRMPIWGVLAILSLLLAVLGTSEQRDLLSFSMLILFLVIYNRFSKPINRLQTEAAKTGGKLDNARALQASWDRSLMVRVPVLGICMLAQFVALIATSA
jgi:hypothetical protein